MPQLKEKRLLREHKEFCRQYEKCQALDTELLHKLLKVFKDTQLSPLSHTFTGYLATHTIKIIGHLYSHYARILETDLAENDACLRETHNPDETLVSLSTRLNKCVDYMN